MRFFNKTSLICCSLLLLSGKLVSAQEWYKVRTGIQSGISGLALITDKEEILPRLANRPPLYLKRFLVVYDNKQIGEDRLAIVKVKNPGEIEYSSLKWPNENPPIDLESVAPIPGKGNTFIALASAGKAYLLKLDAATETMIENRNDPKKKIPNPDIPNSDINKIEVREIPMPPFGDGNNINLEGFALQKVGESLIAVWGQRSKKFVDNEKVEKIAGELYWCPFDPENMKFSETKVNSVQVTAPWSPGMLATSKEIRHASDIRIGVDGTVFVTAAVDNGNDGPFDSFCYQAGRFEQTDANWKFVPYPENASLILYRFPKHKVEAIELVPGPTGGIIFGTDDENYGSLITIGGQ